MLYVFFFSVRLYSSLIFSYFKIVAALKYLDSVFFNLWGTCICLAEIFGFQKLLWKYNLRGFQVWMPPYCHLWTYFSAACWPARAKSLYQVSALRPARNGSAGLSQICFVHAIQAKSFLEPENWLLGKPTQVPCRGCQIECSISSQVRGG